MGKDERMPGDGAAPQAERRAPGVVEECRDGALTGWAAVPRLPLVPAVLDIAIDGAAAGSVKANVFRQELRDQGVRDGFAGFQFKIPERFHDGQTHHVTVTERVSKRLLGGLGVFKIDAGKDHVARADLFLQSVSLASNVERPEFAAAVQAKAKLAILCAYTPDNDLHGHHHRMTEALQAAGFAVLLVQSYAKAANPSSIAAPVSRADAYLVKDNLGYDFGSWLSAMSAVRAHLSALDELLFVNDSVFGPLGGGAVLKQQLAEVDADVVGVCDSYEHNFHLQSFFLLFRKRVLASGFLERFANAYAYDNAKVEVIRDGELGLTPQLQREGFKCEALYPYEALVRKWLDRLPDYVQLVRSLPENTGGDGREAKGDLEYLSSLARRLRRGEPVNPAHFFWDVLIESGCPFVKRELLFKNPMNAPLLFRAPGLVRSTGYPLELIREAAQRYGTARVFF